MPHLILIRNPLSARDREVHELAANARPIDWLQEHYPKGFGTPIRFFVNSEEQELGDLDMVLEPDDVVVIAQMPAIPIPVIITQIIVGVVLSAASLLVGMLFQKPQQPGFAEDAAKSPSPVYSIKNQQNSARVGEPIPVVYGRVLHTPDYCSQPYTFFEGHPGDMYVDVLMVLSQGEVAVHNIFVGDTDVQNLEPGTFSYKIIPPSVHGGRMGRLGFFPDFFEDVVTSPEVGTQQLEQAGDIGWFNLSRTGKKGTHISFDIEFPQGLHEPQRDSAGTDIQFFWQEVDANGNPVGPEYMHQQRYDNNDVTPLRYTHIMQMPYSARWRCKVRRPRGRPYPTHYSLWTWRGAKLRADYSGEEVYGNVTLMAVRMKATRGIADTAQQKIRVLMTRIIPRVEDGTPVGNTSPADAFFDIYCNPIYGARRPWGEIDIPKLRKLKTYWDGYQFNAVYTGKTTVWEALVNSVQGVAAAPLPLGSYMSVQQDGLKPVRSMLFSAPNIVQGSLRLTYDFDPVGRTDSVEVEYRDPKTFSPGYATWPLNGVDPDKVRLFGCTSHDQALQYAKLMWQRRFYQRRHVEFDTELEGLIPHLGERIAVSHTMPKWGLSGYVSAVDGPYLKLDERVPWEWGALYIMLRDQYGGVTEPMRLLAGRTPYEVQLPGLPPIKIFTAASQEGTHYAIGTADTVVKDFVLTDIRPKGGATVTLVGVNYNPLSFQGTLAFLGNPLP